MKPINALVYGKEYTLACDEGQEVHLKHLVTQVNQRSERLEKAVGKLPEAMMLLYTALMTADELHDATREITKLKEELTKARAIADTASSDDERIVAVEAEMAENLDELAKRLDGLALKLAS